MLLLGTLKSSKPEAERRKLFDALLGMTILNADAWTSTLFATTRFQLEKVGGLIPQNDIWIAAAAIQASLPLITRDSHFRRVPHLRLVEY